MSLSYNALDQHFIILNGRPLSESSIIVEITKFEIKS